MYFYIVAINKLISTAWRKAVLEQDGYCQIAETPGSILELLRSRFRNVWFLSEEKRRRCAEWDSCFVIFEKYTSVPHAEIANACAHKKFVI